MVFSAKALLAGGAIIIARGRLTCIGGGGREAERCVMCPAGAEQWLGVVVAPLADPLLEARLQLSVLPPPPGAPSRRSGQPSLACKEDLSSVLLFVKMHRRAPWPP